MTQPKIQAFLPGILPMAAMLSKPVITASPVSHFVIPCHFSGNGATE